MSTTALAVELLVIGYQALIWLALVAFLLPISDHVQLQTLKDWKELVIIGSAVAAYTTGAIINAVTTSIMEKSKIDKKLVYKREKPPSEMRATILVRNPEAFMHIMKNFDAPRVLRSTVLNFILIGIFTFIHLYCFKSLTCLQLLLLALIFVACVVASAWAWYETAKNFYIHLTATYDEVTKKDHAKEEQ
jgi:hypothetical protein